MGTVRGVKGQVKEHKKPKAIGMAPEGRKKMQVDDGKLRYHSCHNCHNDVLAPHKTKRVQCGRCTLLSVEKAREDGKL